MAVFSNQAFINYKSGSSKSNIAYGTLNEPVAVTKDTMRANYKIGDYITYKITITNDTGAELTDLTIEDNLGAYEGEIQTFIPLVYNANSLEYTIDGAIQTPPEVSGTESLIISGIRVPVGSIATLTYETTVTNVADPRSGAFIENKAVISGNDVSEEATTIVPAMASPSLMITKTMNPNTVRPGDTLTYNFTIYNVGNMAADVTENAIIEDTFNPRLSMLNVTFEEDTWTVDEDYTYDETDGKFQSKAEKILIPSATYTQNKDTGEWNITPATAELTISGTVL